MEGRRGKKPLTKILKLLKNERSWAKVNMTFKFHMFLLINYKKNSAMLQSYILSQKITCFPQGKKNCILKSC